MTLIEAERETLRIEINADKDKLEQMRGWEIRLRKVLVAELRNLAYCAGIAEFRIETRQWADGNPALNIDWEHVKEAADALIECVADIKRAEDNIECNQNLLDDPACWIEGDAA
jgi:hypothetical protein